MAFSARCDISVIILTHNESVHIKRCIDSLREVVKTVVVVDSFSTDNTVDIAESLGAKVVQRLWRNYADQFQWALDTCGIDTEWVMRMDADEYLEPELQKEIVNAVNSCSNTDFGGFYIRRKVFFLGKWMRFGGTYPQTLLRIWRNGVGRIEQRWMDEHIVLNPGSKTKRLCANLVDDNKKGITFWTDKCNGYASREMVDLLNNKYQLLPRDNGLLDVDDPQAKWKRIIKDKAYSKLPVGLRASLYFFYRYFIRLGFLDGGNGFLWHFLQGYWYRILVDVKIIEVEKKSGGDRDKIKYILKSEYGIEL